MLAEQRRKKIIKIIMKEEKIKVDELSKRFDVSEVTIRKDLDLLENDDYLNRTHGGAVANDKMKFEFSYQEKMKKNIEEKKRIAKKAVELISDNEVLLMDSGTTVFRIVKDLKNSKKNDITVVTNAVNIINEIGTTTEIKSILLGGEYKPITKALVGSITIKALSDLQFDKFFLGCNGLTIDNGLTTPDFIDAETRKAMIKSSREVIVVTDHTKINRTYFVSIAKIEEIDTIITDKGLDKDIAKEFEETGVELILV